MTPETLQKTRLVYDHYEKIECRDFNRLTLTLSAKGWTASVQWKGTTGARGTGPTPEIAIDEAIRFVHSKWDGGVCIDGRKVRV